MNCLAVFYPAGVDGSSASATGNAVRGASHTPPGWGSGMGLACVAESTAGTLGAGFAGLACAAVSVGGDEVVFWAGELTAANSMSARAQI